jgi:hypothetical protein
MLSAPYILPGMEACYLKKDPDGTERIITLKNNDNSASPVTKRGKIVNRESAPPIVELSDSDERLAITQH